jgi:hypothetical protein
MAHDEIVVRGGVELAQVRAVHALFSVSEPAQRTNDNERDDADRTKERGERGADSRAADGDHDARTAAEAVDDGADGERYDDRPDRNPSRDAGLARKTPAHLLS